MARLLNISLHTLRRLEQSSGTSLFRRRIQVAKHPDMFFLKGFKLRQPGFVQNTSKRVIYESQTELQTLFPRAMSTSEALCPSEMNEKSQSTAEDIKISSKPMSMDEMPGPRGIKRVPYLGTAFLFWPFSKYIPETFGKLVETMHDKYGPVFKIRLGKSYAVHTMCVEDVETVFDSDGQYPLRRLMTLSRMYRLRKGLPQALGTVNGEEWHELRKPLNAVLNKPQACLHYLPAQNTVAEDFVDKLEEIHDDTPSKDIYELFFKFSAESIGVVCFNDRLGFFSANLRDSPEKQRLLDAFHTSLNCTFKAIIGVERRFLRTHKDQFYQTYVRAMDFIRQQSSAYVQKVTDKLKTNASSGDDNNNTDNLLASLIQRGDLNLEQILAIIDSLLIAGSDSTARNLSVLLYNLARHPDIQTMAAKEVRGLIGNDGPVTAQSLGEMNYLKACVKESMRLNYPVTTGPERILSKDTIVSGYLVPKGTSVVITGNKTSVDPRFFPDPFSYKPDRWIRTNRLSRATQKSTNCTSKDTLNDEGKSKNVHAKEPSEICDGKLESGQQVNITKPPLREENPRLCSFAFIPFGHGPRSCIGRRFAELELYVCAARILQKLEIRVDESFKELETIYTPFITPKEPIPFRFSRRQ